VNACGPQAPDGDRIRDALLSSKDDFKDRKAVLRLVVGRAPRREYHPVLQRRGDSPAGAVRYRSLACEAVAGSAWPDPVSRRHREEA
jgi:hypothetical protein